MEQFHSVVILAQTRLCLFPPLDAGWHYLSTKKACRFWMLICPKLCVSSSLSFFLILLSLFPKERVLFNLSVRLQSLLSIPVQTL